MANPGDKVEIQTKEDKFTGILMPSQSDNSIFIKLESGYNIGIDKNKIKTIKAIEEFKEKKAEKTELQKANKNLPNILLLHTGGTIASQVDYRTGAVVSRFSPKDVLKLAPELKDIANLETKTVFQMFTEDMEPDYHWKILADEIDKELKNNPKGIIIGIGTDTLEYVAAALSFALCNIKIPVVLAGSQRSSDRPSTDAAMNII